MEEFKFGAFGIATTPPNSTDTQVALETDHGLRFPTTFPFYPIMWAYSDSVNAAMALHNGKAEIVKVTGISGDTLTIERGQKGTAPVDFSGETVFIGQDWLPHNIDELVNMAGSGGMTEAERATMNDILIDTAENSYHNNLTAINYDGGMYDIFADESKISSKNNIAVNTLDGGDNIGKIALHQATITPDNSQDLSGIQDYKPGGMFFKPDGTIMYIADPDPSYNDIKVFYLSTAWDITTATYDYNSGLGATPYGIWLSSDGFKAYTVDLDNRNLIGCDLSTAWNIGSADTGGATTIDVSPYDPSGIFMDSTGEALYFLSKWDRLVVKYNLSTPWNLSTATEHSTYDFSNDTSAYCEGVEFSSDGVFMYTYVPSDGNIFRFKLSTAWDITTATYQGMYDIFNYDLCGLSFKSDGNEFYALYTNASVHSYNLGTPYFISDSGEYKNSGNIVSVSKDFADDDFTNPPSKVVVSNEVANLQELSIIEDFSDISDWTGDTGVFTIDNGEGKLASSNADNTVSLDFADFDDIIEFVINSNLDTGNNSDGFSITLYYPSGNPIGNLTFEDSSKDIFWSQTESKLNYHEVVEYPSTIYNTSKTDKRGLKIECNEDFSGIIVEEASMSSGITRLYVTDTSGTILHSTSREGTFTRINYNFQAGTSYYILSDAEGGSYTMGYGDASYPYTSAKFDTTTGIHTGSTETDSYIYNIASLQAISKLPISSWDINKYYKFTLIPDFSTSKIKIVIDDITIGDFSIGDPSTETNLISSISLNNTTINSGSSRDILIDDITKGENIIVEYELTDGDNNIIPLTQNDIDKEITVDSFTSTIINLKSKLATNNKSKSPILKDYSLYFKE